MQWSYSRLSTFDNCPKRFFHQYVEKNYHEPPQEHLTWGTRVHTELEERIRDGKPLSLHTEKWEHFAKAFDTLKESGYNVLVEQKLGITREGEAFDLDNIDDERAWGRGIIDTAAMSTDRAVIGDWKTGKVRKDFTQLYVFAKMLFAKYPELQTALLMFIWLKYNKTTSEEVTREFIDAKWEQILKRVHNMEEAVRLGKFPERPSGLCGWCYAKQCSFCPN